MKITLDFDSTLSTPKIQKLAKHLIAQGHEVYVLTCRYCDLQAHRYPDNPTNSDLWATVKELGIPDRNVIFLNDLRTSAKAKFLAKTNVNYHIDDNYSEVVRIRSSSNVIAIDAKTNYENILKIIKP